MKSRATLRVAATIGSLCWATAAMAHAGHAGHGWDAALGHPFTGLDHWLAAMAVGLWAAQLGGRAAWLLPLSFIGMMGIGGGWAAAGRELPLVESALAASVLVLGVALLAATRWPAVVAAAVVGVFALFHGHAHVGDGIGTAGPATYLAGIAFSTALLLAAGVGLATLLRRRHWEPALRWSGAAIALGGTLLSLGRIAG